jgi:hypothetical protein
VTISNTIDILQLAAGSSFSHFTLGSPVEKQSVASGEQFKIDSWRKEV